MFQYRQNTFKFIHKPKNFHISKLVELSFFKLIYVMSESIIKSRLKTHFPVLYRANAQLPLTEYTLMSAPINTTLFDVGSACEQYLLLTEGLVSVKMLSKTGKSVLLYRLKPGQACIITTSCLLGNTNYPTFGESQTDIEGLSMSRQAFRVALNESDIFRQFVFESLGQRLADVMQRLESINFSSIDSRIASTLFARKEDSQAITITHESLAEEVGTAREVVSRHLKNLENNGIISLERGTIILKDAKKLLNLCD